MEQTLLGKRDLTRTYLIWSEEDCFFFFFLLLLLFFFFFLFSNPDPGFVIMYRYTSVFFLSSEFLSRVLFWKI